MERNLAFRGSVEKIGEPCNGNFFCPVELLAKFDPVMGEHPATRYQCRNSCSLPGEEDSKKAHYSS